MALIVTPGADTATSYSSREDAIVRAALDVRGRSFAALTVTDTQDQLLAMATTDIDSALLDTGLLLGEKSTDTQSLELPRAGSTAVPALATQLLAFHYAERLEVGELGTARKDTSNLKEDTTGPLTKVYFERTTSAGRLIDQFPAHVRGHLMPLLASASANYGTGTAVRGS